MTKAEQEAHKTLEECGISRPPVPVEEIAHRLGATVSFEQFASDVSGVLYRQASTAVIGVNSEHAKSRQRFTIAHEIGHLRLHRGRPMFVDHSVRLDRRDSSASLGIDPEEIEANSFAATLLMPEKMIIAAIAQSSTARGRARSEGLVGQLAKRFEVSPQAMEYRLANLGLIVPPQ
jgi:Zn-dependent peptidase ImmA (M78 family)